MLSILRNKKGFTLVELLLVVSLLIILAISAFPQFIDPNESRAEIAASQGVAGAVQTGILLQFAEDVAAGIAPSYPSDLDSVAAGFPVSASTTNPLFSNVLQNPVTGGDWVKTTATCYTGPDSQAYVYASGNGTFTAATACP